MWRVVKILLSGGIRGAVTQNVLLSGFIQNDPDPQPSSLPWAWMASWQLSSGGYDPLKGSGPFLCLVLVITLRTTKTFFFTLPQLKALIQPNIQERVDPSPNNTFFCSKFLKT